MFGVWVSDAQLYWLLYMSMSGIVSGSVPVRKSWELSFNVSSRLQCKHYKAREWSCIFI